MKPILKRDNVTEHELDELVEDVASEVRFGDWLFVEGDLGAGKTKFTAELVAQLGFTDKATSPTFSLLNVYRNAKRASPKKVIHLDLYRVKNGSELKFLGLETEFDANTLAVFEWASQIPDTDWEAFFAATGCLLPKRVFMLQIDIQPDSRNYNLQMLLTRA